MTEAPDDRLFRCPNCGGAEFERGFVDDDRNGRVRWLVGALQIGPFGNAQKMGRARRPVLAHRCVGCDRLELYAPAHV